MIRVAVAAILLIAACDSKPTTPTDDGPTCREALKNSASASGVQAANVEPAIHQCELEHWSATLKTCIQTAPAGTDLDVTCFKKRYAPKK